MNKTKKVEAMYDKYIMETYKRVPLCLEKAKGAKVWDIDGKEYLDFFPGWAVSGIGHCHPLVSEAVAKQEVLEFEGHEDFSFPYLACARLGYPLVFALDSYYLGLEVYV